MRIGKFGSFVTELDPNPVRMEYETFTLAMSPYVWGRSEALGKPEKSRTAASEANASISATAEDVSNLVFIVRLP